MKIITTYILILLLSFNVLAIENREILQFNSQQQRVQINNITTNSQQAHAVESTSTDEKDDLFTNIIIYLLIIMVYWIYWYRMKWF